jgi:dTDP-4-amino-4,6-dideoxygalactose transaminase
MVDLKTQYETIKSEIDPVISDIMSNTSFIGGKHVRNFEENLFQFLGGVSTISCGNGTDALQIALMAINARPGDEVILPAFTYVATAEVIALLGLIPVMVDIDPHTFNIDIRDIEAAITTKTKAIVPVHLFGQSCNMTEIIRIADHYKLYVIEDNAQSLGAIYTQDDNNKLHVGTIGHIGTTSFYPSKVLGAYGDGGAIMTNDDELTQRIKMIANHGQSKKYYHELVGCNSRLDAMQAAILNIKLRYLKDYIIKRQNKAAVYDRELSNLDEIQIPFRDPVSSHVFHQYTLRVRRGRRDELKAFLASKEIPSMIYYPLPLYQQKAYNHYSNKGFKLKETELACEEVLSLPICPELKESDQAFIIDTIKSFFA